MDEAEDRRRTGEGRWGARRVTGVCVLRVGREGDHLRYRLLLTPDIYAGREEVREFALMDDAVEAVRTFLSTFVSTPLPPP